MRRIVPSYHGVYASLVGTPSWYTLPTHHGTLGTPCSYPLPCSTVMQKQASRCTEEEPPGSVWEKGMGERLLLRS